MNDNSSLAGSGEHSPSASITKNGLACLFSTTKTNDEPHIWTNVEFWKSVCPQLTITSSKENTIMPTTANQKDTIIIDEKEAEKRRKCLVKDGYALVDKLEDGGHPNNEQQQLLVTKLAAAISGLDGTHEYPATFVLLYDETWELARIASQVLSSASSSFTNENDKNNNNLALNFDMLAWHIRPGEAGFSPHRDRQPLNVADSFTSNHNKSHAEHAQQEAKYVTLWMALTDATPENSCLYVIPKPYDPGYMAGDDKDNDEDLDPLTRALSTKESYQHIRALPRRAGEAILFTHRILHWGSRGNPTSSTQQKNKPRIAISFVASDASFEPPYLVNSDYFSTTNKEGRMPPFYIRLLLVCAQLLIYYQRFDLPKECIRACYDYCKQYADELEETYRKKVFVEFVKAMKEFESSKSVTKERGKVETKAITKSNQYAEDEDESDEEALMDEMLDAEAGGYGEFEDDYDEIENENDQFGSNADEDDDFDDDEEEEEEDQDASWIFAKEGDVTIPKAFKRQKR